MPFYNRIGQIPTKRHTQFRKPNGELYAEELVSTEGFSSLYSLIYHCHPPTLVKQVDEPYDVSPKAAIEKNMKHRSFLTFNTEATDRYLDSRKVLLFNSDVHIGVAAPRKSMTDEFFKNSDADEVLFIHEGSGVLKTIYGQLPFSYGDYLVIPRGTIYQIHFNDENNRLLVVESPSPIYPPKRYQNSFGQLLEHSPYCERDIRVPEQLETHDEVGEFKVLIKQQGLIWPYTYATHPFDAIGWDGYLYPYAFSIHNFEPITGRIHQPPPVHQTFEGRNYVICSFCPRLYDYHPQAVPAPYNHSNIDSDEILYYVDGDFMSRKHVERGMISLHPKGIPHGPHPGTVEKSLGKKETGELAVMIDPFYPLKITQEALNTEDASYWKSWVD
ncbi:MAG: homogentisate 1,2-dioxygenase [Bacteroidetes bacterium]|nr:homogentisate 1,2-dioxygenase [Bacteroidota bacterium]MDA0943795.1 homogentisate 1,2-dioxygenase [Bacteroidota bacterium]MDA1112271.1 homogentisate 1,2-dioxygenase [Bacteroidota bacterium]